MPVITEAEIEDRSKGDALSKGIAILQLLWFVVQLVARYPQKLPTTLLEIDTLAVAALSCISYCMWWKKPKDVGLPHLVQWKLPSPPPNKLTYKYVIIILPALVLIYLHRDSSKRTEIRWYTFLFGPILSVMSFDIVISASAAATHRVPSLGSYDNSRDDLLVLLIGCLGGILFGGVHCLGWDFLFQKHREQMLWRVSSLAIAGVPATILLLGTVVVFARLSKGTSTVLTVALITFFIYIPTRLILLGLMVLSMRSMPAGVYDTVAWTAYVPHFTMLS